MKVLELGAFIGYSAILIASTIENDAILFSIDSDQNSINICQKMVNFAGLSNKINFINYKKMSVQCKYITCDKLSCDNLNFIITLTQKK